MSFLKVFVESPLAGAIGWTLLHSLWEGAIISGALAVVLAAVHSPRIRYASACAAMLLMLSGFSLTLAIVLPERTQAPLPRSATSSLTLTMTASADSAPRNPSLAPLVPWLTPFWITGVSIIYLRRVASCISVQRLRRRGVCSAPEHWQRRLAQLSGRLRLSRPVQLLESSLADVPAVLGHFRPLILMPVGLLAGLSPGQVEAVLLHELAHVRRHDYLLNILQRLAEGLFFYHPAIWWISRVMRVERENCCDDLAVSLSGDSREYASALAALEQRRHAIVAPAVAATGGTLVKRIHRVLYPTKSNAPLAPFLAATMFIIVAAVSLAAWQSESPRNGSRDVQSQNQGEVGSSYSKWLNEDVVYIIDDLDKIAFSRLSTDEERDRFIEQFWERRNPSPGTATNAFKDEHYRRIAYANAHFGTPSGTPGWLTIRGHVYIVYGRPDEIEAHPNGKQGLYGSRPFEVWIYNHANRDGSSGSFTFVARTGSGDSLPAPETPQSSGVSIDDFRLAPENTLNYRNLMPLPMPSAKPPAAATSPSENAPGATVDGAQVQRVRVSERVMEGLLVEKVAPVYPELAQRVHIEGTVVLRAVIGQDGSIQNLHLISGPPMLVMPAMEAARQRRYKPYLLNGSPVEVETQISIPFGSGDGVGSGEGPPGAGPGYGSGTGIRVFKVGGEVSAPRAVYTPDPEYSEAARKAKLQGTVVLSVIVGADGRPHNLKVTRSLGMDLDTKALEAVLQWKFEPAMMAGKPVAVQINIEVNFRL